MDLKPLVQLLVAGIALTKAVGSVIKTIIRKGEKMKVYDITLQYDVQKRYYVKASSEQCARNKLDNYDRWEKDIETSQSMEDWEYKDTL